MLWLNETRQKRDTHTEAKGEAREKAVWNGPGGEVEGEGEVGARAREGRGEEVLKHGQKLR